MAIEEQLELPFQPTDKSEPVVSRRKIFVFGSNKAGRHGKGAAKFALENYGAIYGLGWAMQGDSYAIPTKGHKLEVLPLSEIRRYVEGFLRFANSPHGKELDFEVTAIGCGLAGYSPEDIAPFFKEAPPNVFLPEEFKKELDKPSEVCYNKV